MYEIKRGMRVKIKDSYKNPKYHGAVGEVRFFSEWDNAWYISFDRDNENKWLMSKEINSSHFKPLIETDEDLFNMYSGKPIDAKFEEVEKTKAVAHRLRRHPLMDGIEKNYEKKLNDYANLANDLGLRNQVRKAQGEMVKEDVKELTENKFHRITREALENLFEIPRVNRQCKIENIRMLATKAKWEIYSAMAFVVFLLLTNITEHGFFFIMTFLSGAYTFIWGLAKLFDGDYKTTWLKAVLKMEPIEDTDHKIPYGALLKMKEAKEIGIFSGFVFATPHIDQEERFAKRVIVDPAVVGVCADKSMYMICYWDIEKDIDRIETDLKALKKLKI